MQIQQSSWLYKNNKTNRLGLLITTLSIAEVQCALRKTRKWLGVSGWTRVRWRHRISVSVHVVLDVVMVIRNSLVRNAGVADHGHCQRRLQDSSDIFTEKSENLSKITVDNFPCDAAVTRICSRSLASTNWRISYVWREQYRKLYDDDEPVYSCGGIATWRRPRQREELEQRRRGLHLRRTEAGSVESHQPTVLYQHITRQRHSYII